MGRFYLFKNDSEKKRGSLGTFDSCGPVPIQDTAWYRRMRRDKEDETEIMYYKLIFRHIPALQKFADISSK